MSTKKENPSAVGLEPFSMIAAMSAANPTYAQAWMDVISESGRFVAERLEADFEAQRALLACRTPAELLQVQAEFYSTAMRQYADEASRLIDLASNGAKNLSAELKSSHARKFDDVPL